MKRYRRTFLASAAALVASTALAQAKPKRIGYLGNRAAATSFDRVFAATLRERGHVDGRDVVIDYRFAADATTAERMIAELVASKPDVIVATGPPARAVAKATATIPIVSLVADPVGQGVAASLSRPGGNLTGITLQSTDLARKRLQLLRDIVPALKRVGVLGFRSESARSVAGRDASVVLVEEATAAARPLGIAIVAGEVRSGSGLGDAFARFRKERVQAVIVQLSPLTYEFRHMIFALAAESRLPAIYETRSYVDEGGLVSYGPDLDDIYRRMAVYVDRILRGATPGELAIEQPGKFELAINLPTATALGLSIPQAVLLRADDVIR